MKDMTKTILVLAANPKDTSRLRLDQEVREIENGLQRAKRRDEFLLKQVWAARPIDVRRAMLDLKPSIVHFCGHGAGDEGIAFEDETGLAKLISAEAIAGFFELFANQVECVVLNACYSEIQAQAIARHISYVVGMKKAIEDKAAIEFSVAFYDALGAGETIEFAFKLACNAIQWATIPEHLTPILKTKPQPVQQGGETTPAASSFATQASEGIDQEWQYVRRLSVNSRGDLFLSLTEDSIVRLWSNPKGELIKAYFLRKPVIDASLTPDGKYVVVCYKSELFGEEIRVLSCISGEYTSTRFTPDEQPATAIWCQYEKFFSVLENGTIAEYLYQRDIPSRLILPPVPISVTSAVFNKDIFALAGNNTDILIGSLANGRIVSRFNRARRMKLLAVSSEGGLLACEDGSDGVLIVKTKTGDEIFRGHSDQVSSAAFSQDDRLLAVGDWDGGVYLYQYPEWECIGAVKAHERKVGSVIFCQDDKYLLSGGGFDIPTIRIWDVKSGRLVKTISGKAAE